MKKTKNKSSAKRLIVILSLCLVLIVALGTFSFAWIRNYVDVDDLEITTGKMLYNFKLYRMNGDQVEIIPFFDTGENGETDVGQSEATLRKSIENALIDVEKGEEVFFVIEKYNNSIDFDVAISFDKDGLAEYEPEQYEYIGQNFYYMADDSSALDGIANQEELKSYIKTPGENPAEKDDDVGENLGNIWNSIQKTSLEGNQKYACIRLKLKSGEDRSAGAAGNSLPFKVEFAVAQRGALPKDMKTDKIYVDGIEKTLEEAMQEYGFGDEIYITQDTTYTGDLVFTRPCTITLIRSTLTVKGNMIFSYMYGDKFVLNTVTDGHVRIVNNEGVAGNFRVDLPDTTLELVGANNDALGKADIYVEGEITVNASKNNGEGFLVKGSRICHITRTDKIENDKKVDVFNYSTDLKPILVNGAARISVANRTRIGKLSTNFYCRKLIIENNGYIEKVDLTDMTLDTLLVSSPAILLDNYGTIGTVNREEGATPSKEDGDVILLPEWSRQFKPNDTTSDDLLCQFRGRPREAPPADPPR